ncbi:hypothetical protein KP509_15G005900 [Ceratopteris richardii]|uniref:Uncharacterized protein n=1 Tax=Ceratopteris richardii TaxID=49495 RepID=A0A8T2T5D3_CERRI|nr:hypothetical protein KP509_15G005900 [Ceratopteris richardii]
MLFCASLHASILCYFFQLPIFYTSAFMLWPHLNSGVGAGEFSMLCVGARVLSQTKLAALSSEGKNMGIPLPHAMLDAKRLLLIDSEPPLDCPSMVSQTDHLHAQITHGKEHVVNKETSSGKRHAERISSLVEHSSCQI